MHNLFLVYKRIISIYIRLYLLMMGLDTPETCRG